MIVGLSEREIARSCQVSRSTVTDYLMKAQAAGLRWPEAATLTEAQIDERLFPDQAYTQFDTKAVPRLPVYLRSTADLPEVSI